METAPRYNPEEYFAEQGEALERIRELEATLKEEEDALLALSADSESYELDKARKEKSVSALKNELEKTRTQVLDTQDINYDTLN
jgi:molecular chaperone GrpE (heat shock protein)